ncbi:CHAD domain-containing protein [Pandoraea iniqua]|uniref:CHAD domain-containing protein n=2 Tax=Pandoraea iniqua TaxID=2508288 RepID=A0A5E4XVR5_9BURK|nr:CHAD domain-containing protein [Pandoraea iniqua]
MVRDMTRETSAASAATPKHSSLSAQPGANVGKPPDIGQMRRMPASHLVVSMAAESIAQWPTLSATHDGADVIAPEAIHHLRIATRRLRALVEVFSPWLKPRWHRKLKRELHWLSHAMGPARDADVLSGATLPALRTEHPDLDWGSVDVYVAKLRSDAHSQADEALLSERQVALHRTLQRAFGVDEHGGTDVRAARALRRASRTPGKQPRAVAKHARHVIRERYVALFPDCRQLAMLDTDQLHALRVRIKKARYSAEALTPWLRKAMRTPYQDTLRAAQNLLGQLNDAVVAQQFCETMPLSQAQRDVLTGRLDTFIVNATSRAAHVLCRLPDAATLDRGIRKR